MDIAIIGLSCKLPGAEDQYEFWNNLINNKNSIQEIPASRWDWRKVWGDPKEERNKTNSRWGGFVADADAFDHEFFGLIPKVVEAMDPQQRMMLELTWKCLEDAGIDPRSVRGRKIGLMFSVFNHDYKEMQEKSAAGIEAHHSTGNAAAIISNRVSHYFDFKGPSLSIDTACSGSLNAIHCAVQALEFGDCEMALTGGINLILTPTRHISFSKMGMMSPTGTCRTFDADANGYVRGEGAGILLLKPLDRALEAGDNIYGVIKGTAVNHCGETYTLTYPSPEAQAGVIVEAHERAGVPVDSIRYVEAHGTGTPKGDPIEFQGLQLAFNTLAERQGVSLEPGRCGLGSVKTNIGHLEAAAGVAGVIKVLMQFRHQQLPAINHFNALNPRISLADSPFYIQQNNQDLSAEQWSTPLRAGVSSFGFGGTNAHIVLEQAPVTQPVAATSSKRKLAAYPVVLSAKSADALQARAADLNRWLQQEQPSLLDLSYTLCTGRQPMACRSAWLVESVEQLCQQLQGLMETAPGSCQIEEAGKEACHSLDAFASGKRMTLAAQRDNLQVLVDAWQRGENVDWSPVFARKAPAILHLPAYRFAQSRFWIHQQAHTETAGESALHPLVHKNISSFDSQAFASRFSGQEFFLAEHRVGGQPVLPGAAYLEMVCRAVRESASGVDDESDLQLTDVTWLRPISCGESAVDVSLVLYPLLAGNRHAADDQHFSAELEVEFEIRSTDGEGNSVIHCQGAVAVGRARRDNTRLTEDFNRLVDPNNLAALESVEHFYQLMTAAGLAYGEAHRGVTTLYRTGEELLVRVSLPEKLRDDQRDQFLLHPALLDSAIQAGVALGWQAGEGDWIWAEHCDFSPRAHLPFLLNSLTVTDALANDFLVRVSLESVADGMHRVAMNFANLDSDGVIQGFPVSISGLTLKAQARSPGAQAATIKPHAAPVSSEASPAFLSQLSMGNREGYYTPQWCEQALDGVPAVQSSALLIVASEAEMVAAEPLLGALSQRGHQLLRLITGRHSRIDSTDHCEIEAASEADINAYVQLLKSRGQQLDAVIHLAPSGHHSPLSATELAVALDNGVKTLFPLTRALMKLARKLQFISLVPDAPLSHPETLGLSGFYKTVTLEKPAYRGKVVQSGSGAYLAEDALLLEQELAAADTATDVLYRNQQRFVRLFDDCLPALTQGIEHQHWLGQSPSSLLQNAAFQHQGVYVITGGMGALGLIFARHLLTTYNATVYLTGRGELTGHRQHILKDLNQLGGSAHYRPCDVADAQQVADVMSGVREQSGRVDGILHAAGVIEDDFIIKKSCDSFHRVIAPKALGTVNLDAATANDELSCFILFSSVTGALGNLGQCDYGFGNAFEDYFSLYRNSLTAKGARCGRALSVNWPYWRNGGMTLTDKEEQILNRNFGIVPLETEAGIKALEDALSLPLSQIAVLPGDNTRVREVLGCVAENSAPVSAENTVTPSTVDKDQLRATAIDDLISLFASELKVNRERFTLDGSFQEFGFDSVVMLDLVNTLEKRFAGLPKTLFFEHQSIAELADFLVDNYSVELAGASQAQQPAQSGAVAAVGSPAAAGKRARRQRVSLYGDEKPAVVRDNRIAIVGLAGRYPEAPDLQTFWKNLSEGRDCISEIPGDRWDLETVFQPGDPAPGKSYSKWGGFLRDVDKFDALFFNISPKEAEKLDPQERLFLETVAHAIEDAGYHPTSLAPQHGLQENPVGVYAGVMWGDYQLHGIESDNPQDWVTPHSFYWSVANRISYFFNFSGPSITLDTACSSSLTAIHLACSALLNDEIKVAIAGGVNLSLHPNKYNLLSDMHFLSSDGRCRSFGEGGDGYVPAEGVGAVILKTLADAERDGDHIYGVIRGTAVNHGGKTSGFTVPNPNRQGTLIQDAMQRAGIQPGEISYIEAHGTGTSLGDPIEISGLSQAFKNAGTQFCALGSAKSNIGHAEAAAGIAGLTKVLLQMKHGKLTPSIHSDSINPYIELEKTPFRLNRELCDWPQPEVITESGEVQQLPRIAGLSSFGAGGANGHILIEEYVRPPVASVASAPVIIPMSARKSEALQAMAANLAEYLQQQPHVSLQSLAYTLQTGRVEHEWRLAMVVSSVAEVIELLQKFASGEQESGEKGSRLLVSSGVVRASGEIRSVIADNISLSQLAELAAAWIKGDRISWQGFYSDSHPQRLPLPGYAYQRQRYWISKPEASGSRKGLHPVLEENTSSLEGIQFRTRFNSQAFFLAEHQINDNRVLPGVVYLEMACQAIANALPGHQLLGLYDVEWLKPLIVNQGSAPLSIQIEDDAFGYTFRIIDSEDSVYCRGAYATLPNAATNSDGVIAPLTEKSPLVQSVRAQLGMDALEDKTFAVRMLEARGRELSVAQLDTRFTAMGFQFGERFQPFSRIFCNDLEAVAALQLSASAATATEGFELNPVLMDAALRTSLAINGHQPQTSGETPLPVEVSGVQLIRPLNGITDITVYAVRKPQARSLAARDAYDIYLLNGAGEVLIYLQGFTTHKVAGFLGRPANVRSEAVQQPVKVESAGAASVSSFYTVPSLTNTAPTNTAPTNTASTNTASATTGALDAEGAALKYLKQILARQTHIAEQDIDAGESVETYGVESVMIHALNQSLTETFGNDISKTLFYEFSNIGEIAESLAESHPSVCANLAEAYGLVSAPLDPEETVAESGQGGHAPQLELQVQQFIRTEIARVTQLSEADLVDTEPFEHFGIDSVMIHSLNEKFSQVFGQDISKTLFYEYNDIASLCEYFMENHSDEAAESLLSGDGDQAAASIEPASENTAVDASEEQQPETDADSREVSAVANDLESQLLNYLLATVRPLTTLANGADLADIAMDKLQLDDVDLVHIASHWRTQLGIDGVQQFYYAASLRALAAGLVSLHDNAELQQRLDQYHAGQQANAKTESRVVGTTERQAHPHRQLLHRLLAGAGASEQTAHSPAADDIAIIGLSGRYPLADDLQAFWHNLSQGRDCIREVPADRWDHNSVFDPDRNNRGKVYAKWGGFMDGVDQFDAELFRMTRREAEIVDPQERLFLQTAWQCLEDAAYTRSSLADSQVGVFVGVMWGHYELIDVSEAQAKLGRPAASFSSIPNRVSYYFDFHGPSLAIDSMCSSSLSAIHTACYSIQAGDCDYAIAGGVNIATHVKKYQLLCQQQFLADDGRCRAFGEGGSGYVPGEGVGAVLLKPLKRALADGDQVYAVIKGSALNHGGKTSGFTVPNQAMQSNVIGRALERSGWSAGQIQYVEAHGTGTSLGDPIELSGLRKALGKPQSDQQRWYLGSVKSNIGHLESAAGIAGLTKILLQMKHGQIVPSLHSKSLNPNLAIDGSGFEVPQQLMDWPRLIDGNGIEQPRRAGLSSFGAGGSNAHLLLEEFIPAALPVTETGRSGLFILSADSENRLRGYVQSTVDAIATLTFDEQGSNQRFHELCYTSLVGREVRAWRLAVVCQSLTELAQRLNAWLENTSAPGLVSGEARNKGAQLDSLFDDSTRSLVMESLFREDRLPQLAGAWVSALDIHWRKHIHHLYPQGLPTRVSLPSQPLVTERFWVEEKPAHTTTTLSGLHPLIDSNDSTIASQRFSKRFTGEEFYLRDHQVENHGAKIILPGVAYLEMVRAAAQMSVPAEYQVRKIRNVMWLKPIQVDGQPQDVELSLTAKGIGMEYRVAGRSETEPTFSTGEVAFALREQQAVPQRIDLEALRAAGGVMESRAEIYHLYREMGFYYGPAYQVTEWRLRMKNAALAKLTLPASLVEQSRDLELHPCLLDGALRTCLGIGDANYVTPMVPFSLGEIEIFAPLTRECYVYATAPGDEAAVAGSANRQTRNYNLLVTDAAGQVLVKIRDISARGLTKKQTRTEDQLSYFNYQWQPTTVAGNAGNQPRAMLIITDSPENYQQLSAAQGWITATPGQIFQRVSSHHFTIDLTDENPVDGLIASLQGDNLLPDIIVNALQYNPESAISSEALNASLILAYHLVRTLHHRVPDYTVRYLEVDAHSTSGNPYKQAISGFANSMVAIHHRFQAASLQLMNADQDVVTAALINRVCQQANFNGSNFRFNSADDSLTVRQLAELELNPVDTAQRRSPLGNVVITGGLGKLGLAVAGYLAEHGNGSVVLVSRRTPDAHQQQQLDALNHQIQSRYSAHRILHRQADMASAEAVNHLFNDCVEALGSIDTVIHAAGHASDASLLDIDVETFCESLHAKVDGLRHLTSAAENTGVQRLIAFSSISVELGDLGTGSYAAANRFMDARAGRSEKGLQLIAINWPLWASGGMQISEEELAALRFSGMAPMAESTGLQALMEIMESGREQVFVAWGNHRRLCEKLRVNTAVTPAAPVETTTVTTVQTVPPVVTANSNTELERDPMKEDGLRTLIREFVCQCVADITRQDVAKIDGDSSFESFGMDSVLLMELQKKLAESVDSLSKTILFEYDCINALTDYFLQNKTTELAAHLGWQAEEASETQAPVSAVSAVYAELPEVTASVDLTFDSNDDGCVSIAHLFNKLPASVQQPVVPEPVKPTGDIAVIGMAGRFPKADNLLDFWRNVERGENCITEVPKVRWSRYLGGRDAQLEHLDLLDRKWGGFIEDVDSFDYEFFGLSKLEAAKMDPQLRLLMETAWHALEDAAYRPDEIRHQRVGVFVGAMNNDHTNVTSDLLASHKTYFGPGSVDSELANRLSFIFDVRGPSLTIKTACSSSMTALHMASSAIRTGDCDMAIVAGVNLSLHPHKYLMLQDMKVLSDGAVEKTFDQNADGLIPSEGVGVVILKAADAALRDRDNVHGLIKATAVSHSGVGAGQFIPNLKVLEQTVQECLDKAGVDPRHLTYIESHGTATALGDPIELKALENIATKHGLPELLVGTKANLGHMEAASGICALIKVLISLREGRIAPCANLAEVSDALEQETPLVFPRESISWPVAAEENRLAGINSFGMGGSNAFAIVAAHQRADNSQTPVTVPLFLLSADSWLQLQMLAESVSLGLEQQSVKPALNDLCYSSQLGRAHRRVRLAVVVKDHQQLMNSLKNFVAGNSPDADLLSGCDDDDKLNALVQRLATEQALAHLQQQSAWSDIADLWVRGAAVGWQQFYRGLSANRISLPGYPFARLNCAINTALDAIKDVERKKRFNLSLVSAADSQAGNDDGSHDHSWYSVQCVKSVVDAEYSQVLDGDGDPEQKKRVCEQYWQQYFADINSRPALIGDSVTSEGERNAVTVASSLDADAIRQLKKVSRLHRVELETLAAAAWATVVARTAKSPAPLFPIKRQLQGATAEQTESYGVFPLQVPTQVRGKCQDWLTSLQSRMNKKHLFTSAQSEAGSPLALLEQHNLHNHYDAMLVFYPAAEKHQHLNTRDVAVIVGLGETDGGLELTLQSREGLLTEADAGQLLKDFIQVLTQLPAFIDKNPAAIPMGSNRRKRLAAIKRLEEA